MAKWLAFDIEIAAIIPDDAQDWKQYRPLGITCAATAYIDGDALLAETTSRVDGQGEFSPRMPQSDCIDLVYALMQFVNMGYTLLTWNGLSFDFDILAEESGMHAECAELATNHVDMMFQIYCVKGFPLGLDAVAKGLGLQGKTEGMSGAKAPELWANGEHAKVLEYVQQDVRTTLEVALAVERRGGLMWISKKGRPNALAIPKWLTVKEALLIPEPDNSWMSDPLPRSKFVSWMEPQKAE